MAAANLGRLGAILSAGGLLGIGAMAPTRSAVASRPVPVPDGYREGLAAWRKIGRVDRAACATCHGPDGLEIAVYDFDDATIRRRALAHLDSADADRVVQFVHAVRRRYGITHRRDPMKDRPFQPGGRLLPGASAAERDLAFGREMVQRLPHLLGTPITGLAEAQVAAEELMAVDPRQIPIGIPFNRFSEDVFHGKEHASLAHWLPDVARVVPPANAAAWNRLQDAYLEDPSDARLWELYLGFQTLTKAARSTGIDDMADAKYRALLLLQHNFRKGLMGKPDSHGPIAFANFPTPLVPNPMWDIGEKARQFQEVSEESIGLKPDLLKKKSGGPSFAQQIMDLQLSWFWLGWLFDQGLERTTRNTFGARGDWLSQALWNGGPYPIHNVFWLARKQLVVNRIPEAWGGMPGRKRPEWDYLAIRIGGRYRNDLPTQPEARRIYTRFLANAFRMSLYLMLEEWRTTKVVWYRTAALKHVEALTDFLIDFEPTESAQARQLRGEIATAIAACEEKT